MTAMEHVECKNCGANISEAYCASCGQREKVYQPSLNQFILALWSDFVSVDAKLVRTLNVLFKPGKFTNDWLDGKQQRYVHPVRLYIFLSVLHSLLLFAGFNGETMIGSLISGMTEGFSAGDVSAKLQFDYSAQIVQIITFVVLPFTIITSQLFRKRDKLIRSVFFVINIYSVLTIFSIVFSLVTYVLPTNINLDEYYLQLVVSFIFIILSATQVYNISFIGAIVKTLLIAVLNLTLIGTFTGIAAGYYEAHDTAELKNAAPAS